MSNTTANSSSSSLSYRAPTEYTPWKDGQTLEQILANAKILEESEPGAGRAYMRDVIRSREEQIAPSSTSEDDQNVCAGPVNCEEPPADGTLFPSLGNVLCAPPEPELVAEERKRRKEEREKVRAGRSLTPVLSCRERMSPLLATATRTFAPTHLSNHPHSLLPPAA